MPGDKADVVMFGPKPIIEDALEKAGHVAAPGLRGAATRTPSSSRSPRRCARSRRSRVTARSTASTHVALPEARDRVELRRRLRPHRRQVGRRARHRRHQHAGRAQRGGRRYGARAPALHRAPPAAGRALPARGPMGEARRLSAHALAARPHRRHRRHGPHRQGDRAPARRHEGAGRLSHAPAGGRRLQALSEPRRHGARRRRAAS